MRRGLLTLVLAATAFGAAAGPASAEAPSFVNGGNFVESSTVSGQGTDGSNRARLYLVIKHDPGRRVTGLNFDDDWNGSDNTNTTAEATVTAQQPAGSFNYSRVSFTHTYSTSGGGLECNLIGGDTLSIDRPYRVRAILDDGSSVSSTQTIRLMAVDQNGCEDTPFLYNHQAQQLVSGSGSGTAVTPGSTVRFTFTGDDSDGTGGERDWRGWRWRARRISDGATTGTTQYCPNNVNLDNSQRSQDVTFPDRGHWVVEAEMLAGSDGDNCINTDPGRWQWMGSVDVNTAATASPDGSISIPRPNTNATVTATATVNDSDDSGEGGAVQMIEWDLDRNTTNGPLGDGFERRDLGTPTLAAGALTGSINTTGVTPGTYTVRARITDNGAYTAADNIRREKIISATYTVNSLPVGAAQTVDTDASDAAHITLAGSDANSDPLTFTISDPPDNGTVTGSGASRTYTPDAGFAGTDTFEYTVDDGFGGTDTETITVNVYPRTTLDAFPPEDTDDNDPQFEFSSQSGATFECKIDDESFGSCTSPHAYTDLADGDHTFTVQATADSLVERAPVSYDFNVDTTAPVSTFGAGLPADPSTSRSAHFEWTTADANSVTHECRIDDGDWDDCTSPQDLSDVQDGPRSFDVRATDEAGNVEDPAIRHTWNVDATPPNTEFTGTTPDASTQSTSADFTWTSDDPLATYECKRDDAVDWTACDPQTEAHFTDLTEGDHSFSVRGTDPLGNVETEFATHEWEVDNTPPETTFDVAPDNPSNNNDPHFEFSSDDPVNGTFECQLDGAGWEQCDDGDFDFTDLADDTYTFEVRATDAAGNEETEPAAHEFEVDTVAPDTSFVAAPPARSNATSFTFKWTSNEPDGATYECRLDGETLAPCEGTERTVENLTDGDHSFEVVATDDAGNTDPESVVHEWEVDTTPPSTELTEEPSPFTSSSDATFEWESDDPNATYQCRLDNSTWESCDSPHELTGLTEGGHLFEVRGVDELGNTETSPEAHLWVIDQHAPDTSIGTTVPNDPTNATTASFEVSSSEQPFIDRIECRIDGGAWSPCDQPSSGMAPWTVTYTDLTHGQHTFEARTIDRTGQADPTPADYTWTVDTDVPEVTFSATPDEFTQSTDAHFEYSSDEAGSTYRCSLDGAAFASCGSTSDFDTLAETAHTFAVIATDPAGNDSPVAEYDWTVDRTDPDTEVLTGPDAITNENEATFTFSSGEPGTFECRLDTDAEDSWTACESGDTFTGIADGDRTFFVRAIDRAGNVDDDPASYGWNIDHTAPVVELTDVEDDPTQNRDPSFSFEADDEDAEFECRLDTAPLTEDDAWSDCDSPFTMTGLADEDYEFQVRATDPRDNVSEIESHEWTVDNEAPTTTITTEPAQPEPGKLNQRTFTFEFESSDANSTFECVLDGAEPVACNAGTFEATDLADGSHSFTVKATDPAQNADATGDTSTFEVDATAPDTEITAGPEVGDHVASDEATFEFTGTDNNGAVTFECNLDDTSWADCTSPHVESALSEQEHTFQVRAKDSYGNVDQDPASRTWTVDLTAPTVTLTVFPAEDSNTGTPTFEWTSSNDVDFFECSDDGAAFVECESPRQLDLEDGPRMFTVRATDLAGNVSDEVTHDWTIDTADPDTTLSEVAGTPADGSTTNATTADFEFGSSETPENFDCKVDDGAWTDCDSPQNLTGFADGPHTFSVRAKDVAGNVDEDPVVRSWTVDTVGPDVEFTTKPGNPSNDETPVFEWTSEAGATFECKLDDAADYSDCASGDEFPVGAGPHTLLVQATDTHTNVGAVEQYDWVVDLDDPTTSITNGPADGTTVGSDAASFEFESPSDANATFECKLDDGEWGNCTSPHALTGLEDGERAFRVRAVDAAGNRDESEEVRTWTVDTTAPTTTVNSTRSGTTQATDVEITFSAPDAASYECQLLPGGTWEPCTSPFTRSGLADSDYTFQVRATDSVNNTENPPAEAEWTVDTGAPETTIDSGPAEDSTVASDEVTFEFSSDDPVDGTFECQLDSEPAVDCDSGTFTEDDLGEGSHTFKVTATDAAGNVDPTAAEREWTVDTTAPDTQIDTTVPAFVNSRAMQIAFSSPDDATATFECQEDGETATWTPCTSPHTLATATADGDRSFRVRAKDAVDNTDGSAADESWTVDTASPEASIDDTPAALTNSTAAEFGFSSNEPTDAEFECKLDAGAFEQCDSGTKSYAGPLDDGDHTFTVKTTDRAGNVSADESYTWKVDTGEPGITIDAGPAALVNSDVAHFEYTLDDATATLECKLDDEAYGACDSTTEHDEEDLTDGEHTFRVKATDPAGNSAEATRTWTVDTAGPNTTIDSGPADATTATSASFTFSSEAGTTFECKLDAGEFGACTSPKDYADLAAGSHTFQVRATDAAGNVDESPAERAWTIASTPVDTNPGGQNPDGNNNPPAGNPPNGLPPAGNPPGGGEPPVCRFAAPGPGCGPAALTAKLSPKKAGAPVDLTLTGDGKGVQLKTVTFTLPRGITLSAVKKARGKQIGTLSYTTLPTQTALAPTKLTLPKKPKRTSTVFSGGGTKVTVKFGRAGKVTLTGLPAGVTKVKLVVKGKRTGLATTAKKCGSLSYRAAFTDQQGGKGSARATDTTCKGSRR